MTSAPRAHGAAGDLARRFADYAPAPEGPGDVAIRAAYGLAIDGRERPAADGRTMATLDPATGAPVAEVAEAGPRDVDRAVAAARRAYEETWRDLPGRHRARHLLRLARRVEDRARELAVLQAIDAGTPIRESLDIDAPSAAAHVLHHAGWADKLAYAVPGRAARPLGVVGQILSWSAPLTAAARTIAPALACGDTVVLKPAATTPLTALLLAEIVAEAGLPPGVVNVVTGGGATGAALAAHPGLDMVAFTGSTAVGREIRRALAGTGRRLLLALGGAGARIVFEDAALDQAVEGIVDGMVRADGTGSRLLVQEAVADDLLERLRRRIGLLRAGDPLDRNTDMGPLDSAARLERLRGAVDRAAAAGCRIDRPGPELPGRGFWFPPTIVTGLGGAEPVARGEVAGPVLAVQTFRTEAEAVAMADATRGGPAAAVWTEKGSRILWMAGRLRAGVVWANCAERLDPASPAGAGRGGGRHGLAEYLDAPGHS